MADEALTKADIEKAVKDATDKLQESIDRLETKNKELIGENRKLKAAGEIKPEDLTAAEDRADKAEARVKELDGEVKKLAGERDKAVKSLETETGFTQKLLIQDGLKSALIANGVKDEDHLDVLTAKFAGGASVKVEGENRTALYGDKPLSDFIKEWAGTDSGKKFVEAPINSGGNAPGGDKNKAAVKTATRTEFDAMSQPDRMKFSSEGGKVVDATA